MYKVLYFSAELNESDYVYRATLELAKKQLDRYIDNGPGNVKRVTALRVDFTNGDYARIVDTNPLCALMLTREERGFDNDGSDSIFA